MKYLPRRVIELLCLAILLIGVFAKLTHLEVANVLILAGGFLCSISVIPRLVRNLYLHKRKGGYS
jgi:hypothetical protein